MITITISIEKQPGGLSIAAVPRFEKETGAEQLILAMFKIGFEHLIAHVGKLLDSNSLTAQLEAGPHRDQQLKSLGIGQRLTASVMLQGDMYFLLHAPTAVQPGLEADAWRYCKAMLDTVSDSIEFPRMGEPVDGFWKRTKKRLHRLMDAAWAPLPPLSFPSKEGGS